ncbi:ribonuclease H-like protein [Aspergillus sclerotiicarbonarius CBS 121057]|uniref:Ribonuclease H-like protein n=1 Tax=Aspergillus sclerotiicarbonarius (strain CBS 121057 / IBT 28362) TaxID=1448318 RepID=A0A319ERZ8_ASPSB|nr:ribonuclease H-like protein [Aspergillus sclerotiicarbonarius CBS 121057]
MALRKAAMSCSSNYYVCTRSLQSLAFMAASRSRSLRRPCALVREIAPSGLMNRYCSTVNNGLAFYGSTKEIRHGHRQGLLKRDHFNTRVHNRALEPTISQVQTRDTIRFYQTSQHAGQHKATTPRSWKRIYRTPAPRFYSSKTIPRPMVEHIIDSKAIEEIHTPETSVLLANSQTMTSKNNSSVPEDQVPAQEPTPILNSAKAPPAQKFWSHTMLKSPEGKDIVVHYCKTLKSSEEVARLFLNDKTIGFDMEWKAQASGWDSIQSNVSLIQIANRERIALFHIALFRPGKKLSDLVPPTLKQIVENPEITKLGVSIKADCTRLRKFLKIDAHGIFELSHLHKLVKYCQSNPKLINKRPVNLSEQVEEHLGLPLEKVEDVRCSDWTASLNYRQVQYAASDSYACVCLFDTMNAKRRAFDPRPPLPAHADLDRPIRIVREPPVATDPNDVEVVKP